MNGPIGEVFSLTPGSGEGVNTIFDLLYFVLAVLILLALLRAFGVI